MSVGDVGCFVHLRVNDSSVVRIAMLMLYAVKSSLFGHSSFLRRFAIFEGSGEYLKKPEGLESQGRCFVSVAGFCRSVPVVAIQAFLSALRNW
jgi:hypothetical protein